MLRLAALASAIFCAAAQQPARFEVVSIKPAQGGRSMRLQPAPGGERYVGINVSLKGLIMAAYGARFDQVQGGPGWMNGELYDLNAKAERPSTPEELRAMLQTLLVDEFHLQFHRVARDGPIYVLRVDPGGPKLRPRPAGEPSMRSTQPQPWHMQWKMSAVTMDYLVFRLSRLLERTIIDRTELKGSYDFELAYTAEVPPQVPIEVDTSGPTIFEAMRRQLGLRLDTERGATEFIVVDHAEKPKTL